MTTEQRKGLVPANPITRTQTAEVPTVGYDVRTKLHSLARKTSIGEILQNRNLIQVVVTNKPIPIETFIGSDSKPIQELVWTENITDALRARRNSTGRQYTRIPVATARRLVGEDNLPESSENLRVATYRPHQPKWRSFTPYIIAVKRDSERCVIEAHLSQKIRTELPPLQELVLNELTHIAELMRESARQRINSGTSYHFTLSDIESKLLDQTDNDQVKNELQKMTDDKSLRTLAAEALIKTNPPLPDKIKKAIESWIENQKTHEVFHLGQAEDEIDMEVWRLRVMVNDDCSFMVSRGRSSS